MEIGDGIAVAWLGTKPVIAVTDAVIKKANAVFDRVVLPGAKEFGLFAQEKISQWRATQAIAFAEKIEKRLSENNVPSSAHAHPRIFNTILSQASLNDDDLLQEHWAGLVASACTEDGDDDSNLIFTNMLGNLTKLQARIIKYSCENSPKQISATGFAKADEIRLSRESMQQIFGENDLERLDREMDNLKAMELIQGGMYYDVTFINLRPTTLSLHMYVRCQGSRLSPVDYFKLRTPVENEPQAEVPSPS